jgi:hypothetical protein
MNSAEVNPCKWSLIEWHFDNQVVRFSFIKESTVLPGIILCYVDITDTSSGKGDRQQFISI